MRLINADACIDDIRNNNQQAWEALAYAPTIDAVEVVRCKDCRWWLDNIGYYRVSYCPLNDDIISDADDFCSYGERIEDGKV